MLDSFGARLRQRREEQRIDLVAIAAQTKIKLSLLEALERDDVSQWPSGIYRRAYIRAYAHAIGLEPDVVVRDFLEAYPEPADVAAAAAIAAAVESARAGGGPPTRLRYLVGSALVSLSRLRRSPGAEDPGIVDTTTVNVPAAAVPDLPAAAPPVADPEQVDATKEVLAAAAPVTELASSDADFMDLAALCTAFGRVEHTDELQPLLQEAARILDAAGLIVWMWDASAGGLRPALVCGYPDRVVAQLPTVTRDADNATAAAFRSAETCAISGSDRINGALVIPLLTPAGCAGVFAVELPHAKEQTTSLRAIATIIAAQLAQFAGASRPAEVRPEAEITAPRTEDFTAPVLRATAGR